MLAEPAFNKRYTLRLPIRSAPGFQSARSFRNASFPRLLSATFGAGDICFRKVLLPAPNVVYLQRYVQFWLKM